MPAASREIAVNGASLPLTEVAYTHFNQARIDLILNAKGAGAPLPTFYAYLELAARYELDPLANEIWLAEMKGKHQILVGRDGYLKIAKRDEAFVSVVQQAVYENDFFAAEYVDDEIGWKVEHKITNLAERGRLLGGWARLLRKGYPAAFFFAEISQFKKNPEKSAWSYTDAMITKCASSYVLRTTYNVAGPVPADEVRFDVEGSGVDLSADAGEARSAELPEALAELVARAETVDPSVWRANEVAARLPDADHELYAAAVGDVVEEITAWLAEQEPADAEVVDGQPARAPEQTREALRAWVDTHGSVPIAQAPAKPVDERTVQERWASSDPEDMLWQEKVQVLLNRRLDLQQAVLELEGRQLEEVNTELDQVEEYLTTLGVPAGWTPPIAGQASLEL